MKEELDQHTNNSPKQQAQEIAQRCAEKIGAAIDNDSEYLTGCTDEKLKAIILQETGLVELVKAQQEHAEYTKLFAQYDGGPEGLAIHISNNDQLRAELQSARNEIASLSSQSNFACECGGTKVEVERLRAELAEAKKDKERLDWVDKNAASIRVIPEIYLYRQKGTFRTAIDAAMKGERV